MSLLHLTRSLSTLTASAALLLLTALPVAAQQPRIPPDARGYQTTMIIQQAHQAPAARQPSPVLPSYAPAPSSVGVSVNVPNVTVPTSTPTTYVTIRGLDGQVRRFPLARGVEVQYRRGQVVLRPGESTTIRLAPVY
jgi:hypothetical protein